MIPNDSSVEQEPGTTSKPQSERLETSMMRRFLMNYWVPALSSMILIFVCLAPDTEGHKEIAKLLSKPVYDAYIVVTVALLLLTAVRHRSNQLVTRALDVIVCSFLVTQSMHLLFHLPRPSGRTGVFSQGFPSGHTTFAFALAWVILDIYPPLAPFWFALAVAIGWSRIAAHEHFPYQVICGAVIGATVGWWVSHAPQGVIVPRCFRRGRRQPVPRADS
jgi:membrane-associated phospholipid phosphatase